MSFDLMKQALHMEGLTPTEKLTLVTIASHENTKTGRCNPSLTRIANITGYTRRGVIKAVNSLVGKGRLIKVRGGKSTQYEVVNEVHLVNEVHQTSERGSPVLVNEVHPNKEENKERTKPATSAGSKDFKIDIPGFNHRALPKRRSRVYQ